MVAVCALVKKAADGTCEDVRIGLTHMGSTPLRATAVEEALRGQPLDADVDRRGGRAGGRGHRPAGRPQRDAGLQAPPRARAVRGARSSEAAAVTGVTPSTVRRATSQTRPAPARATSPTAALATAVFLAADARAAAAARGRGRRGQDRGGAGAGRARRGARLIRLQCHEGIDLHHALYDWDYPRQLLAHPRGRGGGAEARELFGARVPAAPAAARGARADGAGRAADRRDRPRRRRVRGVPARVPVATSGHDPRAGHGQPRSGARSWC